MRPATDSETMSMSLRNVRRSFVHKLENRPALDMVQYGNVTLVHKKLDSGIDGRPELDRQGYSWTEDHKVLKLEHDHMKCRKQRLFQTRSKLQRSWSGNLSLIQRESLIDVIPKAAVHLTATGPAKKRTKPRRISSRDRNVTMDRPVRAKDVLLDGDLQTVRKVVLERKLRHRPVLPNAQDYQEGLFRELKKRQAAWERPCFSRKLKANNKTLPQRIIYRANSMDGHPVRRPTSFMPQSA